MKNLHKYINIVVLVALCLACWGEFILCFIRAYSELWYTILVPSLIVTALAFGAFFSKFRWLYFIATVIVIAGAVLLIGFPSYVMYLAIICGAVALAGQIMLWAMYIKNKKIRAEKSK